MRRQESCGSVVSSLISSHEFRQQFAQHLKTMSVFDSMKHAVHTVFKETVEAVTPVSNVSQFRDKGVLTPEEFVAAGDLLVFKCPSWTWEAGDPSKTRDYLPKDKQYLVTRNVPCHRRADGLASSVREMQMEDAEDGEWTETQARTCAQACKNAQSPLAGLHDDGSQYNRRRSWSRASSESDHPMIRVGKTLGSSQY